MAHSLEVPHFSTDDDLKEEYMLISKLLFEDISQILYSVLLGLNVIEQQVQEGPVSQHFQSVKQLAAQSLERVRSYAAGTCYYVLATLGLIPALFRWTRQFEANGGCKVRLETAGFAEGERIASEHEMKAYSIVKHLILSLRQVDDDHQELYVKLEKSNGSMAIQCGGRIGREADDSAVFLTPQLWGKLSELNGLMEVKVHAGEDALDYEVKIRLALPLPELYE
ncbi:hypothetical protein [Paenibacillus thermotolerans]|uniref:hypothetical protein n=1 Tax=Paenibacillus thermotolerans TaxID=3027807 RepID=UPI0023675B32|nr:MULTISPECIES: hypothetical protein [unclassified Paenibacillus]